MKTVNKTFLCVFLTILIAGHPFVCQVENIGGPC